jgi:hypothetical protein
MCPSRLRERKYRLFVVLILRYDVYYFEGEVSFNRLVRGIDAYEDERGLRIELEFNLVFRNVEDLGEIGCPDDSRT